MHFLMNPVIMGTTSSMHFLMNTVTMGTTFSMHFLMNTVTESVTSILFSGTFVSLHDQNNLEAWIMIGQTDVEQS
jgi:hypothetical protein